MFQLFFMSQFVFPEHALLLIFSDMICSLCCEFFVEECIFSKISFSMMQEVQYLMHHNMHFSEKMFSRKLNWGD